MYEIKLYSYKKACRFDILSQYPFFIRNHFIGIVKNSPKNEKQDHKIKKKLKFFFPRCVNIHMIIMRSKDAFKIKSGIDFHNLIFQCSIFYTIHDAFYILWTGVREKKYARKFIRVRYPYNNKQSSPNKAIYKVLFAFCWTISYLFQMEFRCILFTF